MSSLLKTTISSSSACGSEFGAGLEFSISSSSSDEDPSADDEARASVSDIPLSLSFDLKSKLTDYMKILFFSFELVL